MQEPRRISLVVGTRPEAVKLGPVAGGLAAEAWARPVLLATGQHEAAVVREALRPFDLVPDVELANAEPRGTLEELLAGLERGITAALRREPPDLVVVQGDTTSALAGAVAGHRAGIPIAHVEAGLRTHDLSSPFPEEGNRRRIAQLAQLHLAPTDTAVGNLVDEGIERERIVLTGNTVVDALLAVRGQQAPFDDLRLETLVAGTSRLVLVTAHRRESWGEPMRRIGSAVAAVARRHPDATVVVVTHMNHAVRETLAAAADSPNVHLTEPLGYACFVRLLARASLVLTDSGGVQEEAPVFGVPVLVMRSATERVEALTAGAAQVVGTDVDRIVDAASSHLAAGGRDEPTSSSSPFGDGQAARRTVDALAWLLGLGSRPDEWILAGRREEDACTAELLPAPPLLRAL